MSERLGGGKKATKQFLDRRRAAGLPITREALRREFPELSWREINQLFDEVKS